TRRPQWIGNASIESAKSHDNGTPHFDALSNTQSHEVYESNNTSLPQSRARTVRRIYHGDLGSGRARPASLPQSLQNSRHPLRSTRHGGGQTILRRRSGR